MPLSLQKLQDFLSSKGYIPHKYFIMDGTCFYIELYAVETAQQFLLYIPSKYKFEMKKGHDVHVIQYIDMSVGDSTTDDYAGSVEDMDLSSTYGDAQIDLSPAKGEKIEEHLEDNYKHPISLNDISIEDTTDLKAIYRQMRRLRYCVENIKYKVGVFYKNYLCSIRRDDSIDCFSIKHYPRKEGKHLMIITDLETFYEKNEKLLADIQKVQNGIYSVLQRNQSSHARVMKKLLENKEDITSIAQRAHTKNVKYEGLLTKLEKMMSAMNQAEQNIMAQLYELNENTGDVSLQGMQSDIERVHKRTQLEKDLEKVNALKEQIARNMLMVREKRANTILNVDKILFDNTVMFDCMVKNFAKLKGFC